MCYFKELRVDKDERIRLLDLEASIAHLAHLLTPVQDATINDPSILIVPNADKSGIEATAGEWGLLPDHVHTLEEVEKFRRGYYDDKGVWRKYDTMNARGEKVFTESKMFKMPAQKYRCLIPASAFFEFRHVPKIGTSGKPLARKEAIPYRIFLQDEPVFFIAGFYNPWLHPVTQQFIKTFSMLTTKANPVMKVIHNKKAIEQDERMPVVMRPEIARKWLMEDVALTELQQMATYQHDYHDMRAYPIPKNFKDYAVDATAATYYANVDPIVIDGTRYDFMPDPPDQQSMQGAQFKLF